MLFLLLPLLVGCSGVPGFSIAPNPPATETELYSETVYIRNCADYKNEKRTPLTERAPLVVHVVVADQAISEDTGEKIDIPDKLKQKLQTKIEKEFEDVIQEKLSIAADVDLVIPAFSIRIFQVNWKQRCSCSIVAFKMDGETYTADYSFKLEFPTLTQTQSQACTA
jgi:hypothetical protein